MVAFSVGNFSEEIRSIWDIITNVQINTNVLLKMMGGGVFINFEDYFLSFLLIT